MLLEHVRQGIRTHRLLRCGETVIIGVSGGPDSVALLYALNSLKKDLRLNLHVAHLDHMLRPDSEKDRIFVQGLALKLGIPCTSAQVNVKAIARKGSLEEVARNARFAFFFRLARQLKARTIALGHNFDDQAETVLMRILRGSGLYGLTGILPQRQMCGFRIIRPLIGCRRTEILRFLKTKRVRPRLDASNLEDIYFRNKVRRQLIPLLEKKYNKNIKEVLCNLAQSAGYDYDYLLKAARRLSDTMGSRLALKKLLALHPSLRRLLYRLTIARLQGDLRRITFTHTREIDDLVFLRPVNSIVDLPQGISATKKRLAIRFYRRKPHGKSL
ncbi:MAG TPA: tRNA lysidine(34) synthetase TilS [Patescibacteria group bacterium]|nr:tRNA lysidine(34) synthetase TilS [Patescibacteria group bacterium]